MHFPLAAAALRQAGPLLLCRAVSSAGLYSSARGVPLQVLPDLLPDKSAPNFGYGHVLELLKFCRPPDSLVRPV